MKYLKVLRSFVEIHNSTVLIWKFNFDLQLILESKINENFREKETKKEEKLWCKLYRSIFLI
jgi:hypothetical protein